MLEAHSEGKQRRGLHGGWSRGGKSHRIRQEQRTEGTMYQAPRHSRSYKQEIRAELASQQIHGRTDASIKSEAGK